MIEFQKLLTTPWQYTFYLLAILHAQEYQRKQYNKNAKEVSYGGGDLVIRETPVIKKENVKKYMPIGMGLVKSLKQEYPM